MTYKLVYLARRAAKVARADWPRTWKSHAIFASQFPVLEAGIDWMRYCNRVDGIDLPGLSSAHDGVSVAGSQTLEALNGAGFTPEDRARIDEDELRVFDMLTPNFTFYCEEQQVVPGATSEAAVFSFLARHPEMSHAEFDERWSRDHAGIAAAAFSALGMATRYVHNRPLHDQLPLFPFDGIAEAWFPSIDEAVAAFRGRELDPLRQDLSGFCDFTRSAVVLTTVCHRWPKG